jgi:hypothetical protein
MGVTSPSGATGVETGNPAAMATVSVGMRG